MKKKKHSKGYSSDLLLQFHKNQGLARHRFKKKKVNIFLPFIPLSGSSSKILHFPKCNPV